MMKKERIGKRVVNAIRALRGDPWPPVVEFDISKINVQQNRIETYKVEHALPLSEICTFPEKDMFDYASGRLAAEICDALLRDGAIEISRTDMPERDISIYRATVKVAAREEEQH